MWPNPQFPAHLVTFNEEILNGKLHFLCSVCKTAENEDVTLVNVSNFGDGKIGKKREISLIKIFLITYWIRARTTS